MKPYSPKDTRRGNEKLNDALKDDSPYIAERKLDGCRYLTIDGRIVSPRISSTTGENVDKTENLPHLRHLLRGPLANTVLDGEICTGLIGSKAQDVVSVMGCLPAEAVKRQEESGRLHYVVFDIVRSPVGVWLYNKPWKFRRQMLESLADEIENDYVHLLSTVYDNKERFFKDELAKGEEGIILKHSNGKYVPGKRPAWNWIKLKSQVEDDVIILGFEPPSREYTGSDPETWPYWENGEPISKNYARDYIGSIRFGKYTQDGSLVELGTCSGMADEQRRMLSEDPDEYIGRVIKIQAMEITRDNAYRHPRFIMIHPDKNPEECIMGTEEG